MTMKFRPDGSHVLELKTALHSLPVVQTRRNTVAKLGYYIRRMAMDRRKRRARQASMRVATQDLRRRAAHRKQLPYNCAEVGREMAGRADAASGHGSDAAAGDR